MGVKFVTPKNGDAVAVVARSVEAKDEDDVVEGDEVPDVTSAPESSEAVSGATIDETDTDTTGSDTTGESEG